MWLILYCQVVYCLSPYVYCTASAHPLTHTELERCLHNRLKDFHDLLSRRPQGYPNSVMSTTAGDLDPPLGNTRLQVVRLFASILQCGSSGISTAMMQLRTFSILVVSSKYYMSLEYFIIQINTVDFGSFVRVLYLARN